MNYIISVDQSTSATKAVMFNEHCQLVNRINLAHQQYYPQPGWVEHDAEEIYHNTVEVIRQVVEMNKAAHFYEVDEEAYLNRIIIEETGKSGVQLPTGGSVANNGLSLLVQMGFKTIILVGQDLAYPNFKLHTKAAYSDENNMILPEQNEYVLVEDVHGNLV